MILVTEQWSEHWFQYLISNTIALVVVLLAWKMPTAARIGLGIIFVAASIANIFVAIIKPQDYLNYGQFSVLDVYRSFIDGWFAEHTRLFVLSIAAGQFFIGVGMFANGALLKPALIGIVIFGLAIAPLGVGSAFPCSVLLAFAAIMLCFKSQRIEDD